MDSFWPDPPKSLGTCYSSSSLVYPILNLDTLYSCLFVSWIMDLFSSLLYWGFHAVVMVRWVVRCFQNIFSFRCRFWGPRQMPVKSKRHPWLVTPHTISLSDNYCQSCDLLLWFLSHLRSLVFYFDNFLISRNVFCWPSAGSLAFSVVLFFIRCFKSLELAIC